MKAVVIGVMLSLLALVVSGLESRREDDIPSDWQERIRLLGAAAAYEEMTVTVERLPEAERHAAAHAFGGALYQTIGVEGLSVCDSRFSYACFHEFLAEALAGAGMDINELNDACLALPDWPSRISCQHGLGHGVLVSRGYDREGLSEALAVCAALERVDPIAGCFGGVYMEYNLRSMSADGFPRAFDARKPYAPCDALPERYRQSCFFWLPQWWGYAAFDQAGISDIFAGIGKLCAGLKGPQEKRACIAGAGNVAPLSVAFDPERTVALCAALAISKEHQLICRAFAEHRALFEQAKVDHGAFCQGLSGSDEEYCLTRSR